jgi:hypothetical protein
MLKAKLINTSRPLLNTHNLLAGFLQHVVTVPARNGNECDSLRVVADLLDEGGGLLNDLIETVLTPLLYSQLPCIWI